MQGRKFIVYQLRAATEDRPFYIGKTFEGSNRFRDHLGDFQSVKKTRKNHKIKKLLKLGEEILFEVLYEFTDEATALAKECELILEFGRIDLGTGFLTNHTDGGEGTCGRFVSEEERLNISLRQVGRKQPSNVQRFSKKVTAFFDDGSVYKTFPSAKEACEELGLYDKAIAHSLRGTLRHAKAKDGSFYRFRLGELLEPIDPLLPGYANKHYNSIEVSLFRDDGTLYKVFETASSAAEYLGKNPTSVRSAIDNELRRVKGKDSSCYRVVAGSSKDSISPWSGNFNRRGREVIQLDSSGAELGRFKSAAEAARSIGLSSSAVTKCASGENSSAGGFYWKYVE